jgi:hypothetical protein
VIALPEGLDLAGEARNLLLGLGRAVGVVHGTARLEVLVPDLARNGRIFRSVWPSVAADLHACGVEGALCSLETRERVPGFAVQMHPGETAAPL